MLPFRGLDAATQPPSFVTPHSPSPLARASLVFCIKKRHPIFFTTLLRDGQQQHDLLLLHLQSTSTQNGHSAHERCPDRHRRRPRSGCRSGTPSPPFWRATGCGHRPQPPPRQHHHPFDAGGLGQGSLSFHQRASAIGATRQQPRHRRIFNTKLLHCPPRQRRVRLWVFENNHTQMKGGTGWTVEFAKQFQMPIFSYDLLKHKWYRFNYHTKTFHAMGGGNFPLLSDKSAIVGARTADSYLGWKTALAGLFERTLCVKHSTA